MEKKLKSWGLGDYSKKFKEHKVDLETINLLSDNDINDLIPEIGPRAHLRERIATWKTSAEKHPNRSCWSKIKHAGCWCFHGIITIIQAIFMFIFNLIITIINFITDLFKKCI